MSPGGRSGANPFAAYDLHGQRDPLGLRPRKPRMRSAKSPQCRHGCGTLDPVRRTGHQDGPSRERATIDVIDLQGSGPTVHPSGEFAERWRPEVCRTARCVISRRHDLGLGVASEHDTSDAMAAYEAPAFVGAQMSERADVVDMGSRLGSSGGGHTSSVRVHHAYK